MEKSAASLEEAVKQVYKEQKILTYDQGGSARTDEFAQAVMNKLR
jgi:isocitrate/isopropylmalate dehydrogenase